MTLPDHVVEFLERHPEPDRVVIDAVHRQMAETMTTREILTALGFQSTAESRAWAKRVLQPLTEEQRAENRRRLDLIRGHEWPEDER